MNRPGWTRRQALQTAGVTALTMATAATTTKLVFANPASPGGVQESKPEPKWISADTLSIEGRGFTETERFFDRLPSAAKDVVRKQVWDLSRDSSGMLVRFQTDSKSIHVSYQLLKDRLAMPHMPATSVSGVDLYAETESGDMRWVAVGKPGRQTVQARLIDQLKPTSDGKLRTYQLYLPLYNGIDELKIGVDAKATIQAAPIREVKPIVFYGTSIMHGACASRSGMSISAILGRRLNRPVINLGFSGNGRMEKEVGQFVCQLDASVFVVDCLPNLGPKQVTERCEPLVRQIRKAHPDTPILLVEDRVFTNAWIRQGRENFHADNQKALREAYDRLSKAGINNLHYLPGKNLLGDDREAATDGSHPNDLGMMRYADAYEPVLRKILGR